MVWKLLISIGIIVLMILAGIKVAAEIRYSYKSEMIVDGKETTCYFDRGWFNLPGARLCTQNKKIIIDREDING